MAQTCNSNTQLKMPLLFRHIRSRPRPCRYQCSQRSWQKGRPRKVKAVPTVTDPSSIEPASASTQPQTNAAPAKIDKSQLTFGEPRRLRDKAHLKFVASQPCLICGRIPVDAHDLRFAQPRAMGLKVSDEFTVPLCRTHHRDNHSFGDEMDRTMLYRGG